MKNKLLKIIQHYGIENQLRKFNEESYELTQAIDRFEQLRSMHGNKVRYNNIKAEIADNFVLISQFILYYDLSLDEIFDIYKFKVDRQIKRITKKD